MNALSAVVISLNEEKNIGDCLASLRFCDERIVVDSGSGDQTVPLAERAGAKVFRNPFKDFADQKNYGIAQAAGQWVLLVDADERVSEELALEIKQALAHPTADGYYLKRKNRIFGRWMRFGGHARDTQLRLVRKDQARFHGLVHERVRIQGKTARLRNPLLHDSTQTVADYMKKLNCYSALEVKLLEESGAAVNRRLLTLRPCVLFLRLLVLKTAFRDGLEGVLFAVLSAYYEFIRWAKYWELRKNEP